ncbi:MAG: sodium dependent phosphate transporter, partial [Actinomycetota bacterium]|nr:sodium dependent phosphate transporter [Actinomycetota bacterium]
EALTVAIVHTLFNVGGIVLLYPMPYVRDIPIRLSENLAKIAINRRVAAVVYVVVVFIVVPLLGVAILR